MIGNRVHVINSESGKILIQQRMNECPRIGDELRLSGERYFKVVSVYWCLDEPDHEGQRVNIGVVPSP